MTKKQIAILRQVCDAMLATVNESPNGAPAGPMYMACMEMGMSLEVFETVMSALVTAGKIRKLGHVYYPVKRS
jgi:hypothetical protein